MAGLIKIRQNVLRLRRIFFRNLSILPEMTCRSVNAAQAGLLKIGQNVLRQKVS